MFNNYNVFVCVCVCVFVFAHKKMKVPSLSTHHHADGRSGEVFLVNNTPSSRWQEAGHLGRHHFWL